VIVLALAINLAAVAVLTGGNAAAAGALLLLSLALFCIDLLTNKTGAR
jgi:hypothetical protein